MSAPLENVRIVDLTTVVMGPSATQYLAQLGADVIKVESPEGDGTRHIGVGRNPGMSGWFLGLNRGKRSIALDLKTPAGREALLRLCEGADILVYNVRPDAMDRLGLGYREVSERNPRLVYVGGLGYGRDGRYAGRPAYDDLVQAATGLPWLYDRAGGGEPRFVPAPLIDRLTGIYLAMTMIAALRHRDLTGAGSSVDVPMFEVMADVVLGDHFGGERFEPAIASWGYQRMLAPHRKPYRARDGFIAALPYHDRQWRALFAALGCQELYSSDERFSTNESRLDNIDALYQMFGELTPQRTVDEWMALFGELDIAAMPVRSIEDLINDSHLVDAGFFETVEHESEGRIRDIRLPSTWSNYTPDFARPAPRLGEHNRELLTEAGYSDEEIRSIFGDCHESTRP